MTEPEIYKVQHINVGPFPFYIFIHATHEDFVKYGKKHGGKKKWGKADAMTYIHTKLGITLHFVKDRFHIDLVAHEATHAALWSLDRDAWPKNLKVKLFNHPEKIAVRVGSLTALIWLMLPDYQQRGEEAQVADWVQPPFHFGPEGASLPDSHIYSTPTEEAGLNGL